MGIENYFNAKSSFQQTSDLIKDMPSLRSFGNTFNENTFKDLERQYKGKWRLE